MSPTAKAREATEAATLPQGWDPLPPIGRWSRCASLQKPGTIGSIGLRAVAPAGSVEVDGTIRRDGVAGQLCVRWVGHFSGLKTGISYVCTALLVRA